MYLIINTNNQVGIKNKYLSSMRLYSSNAITTQQNIDMCKQIRYIGGLYNNNNNLYKIL